MSSRFGAESSFAICVLLEVLLRQLSFQIELFKTYRMTNNNTCICVKQFHVKRTSPCRSQVGNIPPKASRASRIGRSTPDKAIGNSQNPLFANGGFQIRLGGALPFFWRCSYTKRAPVILQKPPKPYPYRTRFPPPYETYLPKRRISDLARLSPKPHRPELRMYMYIICMCMCMCIHV